jgi:hypothetical protein
MKRLWSILIVATLHTAYADDVARKQWESKITLLTNGMTRAQVELIFPTNNSKGKFTFGGGGAYTVSYALDDTTEIALNYDDSPLLEAPASNRLLKVIGLRDITRFNLSPTNENNK